ncbi:MAG: uL15 family ribosomal protein [Candidatus Pacebacteria bacterium]|nr:uL15 family ribosomal protein [Candidatus Paceibacterota bacterium]
MANLTDLIKIKKTAKKRRGRGYGSGKGGHTTGRGAKGEKSRGKVGLIFAGTKLRKSLVRRLPFRRGKGKFKSLNEKPVIVNLEVLNLFPKDSLVDLGALVKKGVVSSGEAETGRVKILGGGKLEVSLKVALPCSRSAAEKILKAGGQVTKKNE